jgi:hypothetical protein
MGDLIVGLDSAAPRGTPRLIYPGLPVLLTLGDLQLKRFGDYPTDLNFEPMPAVMTLPSDGPCTMRTCCANLTVRPIAISRF